MSATPPRSGYMLPQAPPPRETSPTFLKVVAVGCGIAAVGLMAFIAVLVFVVFGAIKRSDAYRTAYERATSDPRVQAALGTPIESGWFVRGNVNINNDAGGADLRFSILGSKQDGSVHVVGDRERQKWTWTTMTVTPDNGPPIDLLKK